MTWQDKQVEPPLRTTTEVEQLRQALHFWMKRIRLADLDDFEYKLFQQDSQLAKEATR